MHLGILSLVKSQLILCKWLTFEGLFHVLRDPERGIEISVDERAHEFLHGLVLVLHLLKEVVHLILNSHHVNAVERHLWWPLHHNLCGCLVVRVSDESLVGVELARLT